MSTVIFTIGLPGSGKSTEAKKWVNQDPKRRARVNRDDIRAMVHPVYMDGATEMAVNEVQQASLRAFLRAGRDVIIDDTNLVPKHLKELIKLSESCGAGVEFWDQFLDVPIEVCQARNLARSRVVPPEVIQRMYDTHIKGKTWNPPDVSSKSNETGLTMYTPDPEKPPAIIVDIDGTVARNTGGRGFYDWHRVGEDEPIASIIDLVRLFDLAGFEIIMVSGRDAECRYQTEFWLDAQEIPWTDLYMRPEGNNQKDSVIKPMLFDRFKNDYNIQYVIDDRQQVVDAWRAMGLTVLQCAPGSF